jgi:hypothetical protein
MPTGGLLLLHAGHSEKGWETANSHTEAVRCPLVTIVNEREERRIE